METERRLIVAENISANGVIEFLDPWFDPGEQEDAGMLAVVQQHMRDEDALILGRQTFEDFRGYWPFQTDDATGSTEHLNRVQKYVVSTTLTEPEWQNSTILQGRLEDEVAALKAQPGRDIGVTGSISVVHALMRVGLVDEYRLWMYPVLTSRGRNLVPDDLPMSTLRLIDNRTFESGVTLLVYR